MENAWEAIQEKGSHGQIIVSTRAEEQEIQVKIIDNGIGMSPDILEAGFRHGFTTRQNKKGFGLHYSANAMTEMSATISLVSKGIGQGATVTLHFPK